MRKIHLKTYRRGLSDQNAFRLRVRGEADELPKLLHKVKGVQKVEVTSDGSVEFQFAPGQDVRPEVAKAVINADYELLEMRPVGMSLEEIFLELTREDTQFPPQGEVSK